MRGHSHHWHVPITHQKHTGSTDSMLCPKSGPWLAVCGSSVLVWHAWTGTQAATGCDQQPGLTAQTLGDTDMLSLHDSGDGHFGHGFQRITSIFPFPAAVDMGIHPCPLSLLAQHHLEKSQHHEKYTHSILTFIKKWKKKKIFSTADFFF